MPVHITLSGPIRSPRRAKEFTVVVATGTSVRDFLKAEFSFAEDEMTHLVVMINGVESRLSAVLQADDALHLFLPVGGG